MSSIKACIFDLDGVIVETNHFHFLSWKRLADELGIHFTEKENEQLKGVSRKDSLDRILKLGEMELPADRKEELMEQKNEWYLEYLKDMAPSDALPGVVDFLTSLKEAGIKTALASSSKNAKAIIAKLELNHLLDALKDGNDVTFAKPDPTVFLEAAKAINEKPENCIVFEDALAGVEAAKRAGMRCVGVGEKNVLTDANHVIGSFEGFSLGTFKEVFNQ